MKYKQLTFEQRYTIECLLKTTTPKAKIAQAISVSESSVYRELKRNSKPRGSYKANYAQELAEERKDLGHLKTRFTDRMKRIITAKLLLQWSPEQIKGWCDIEALPIPMVSHERICQYIWADKKQGGSLYLDLRTGQKKYKKRYGVNSSRGQIPDRLSIESRPKIVEDKIRVGDFESDLIIGKNHKGALLTIIDRYSSFVFIEDVKNKGAHNVAKMTINALVPHKKWVHTITNDNGKEFTEHQKVANILSCYVFFAHPYSSWARGLNEYTNKLIRQYFPKNETHENIQQKYINEVIEKLNNRPRKKLNFKTSKLVFYHYIYNNKKVALASAIVSLPKTLLINNLLLI